MTIDNAAIRAAFAEFQDTYLGAEGGRRWLERYREALRVTREATEAEWMTPTFQKVLWEGTGITGIGSGSAVAIPGAYEDEALARRLLGLRDEIPPPEPQQAGLALQNAYSQILDAVRPDYNTKRPQARIVRLLARLFPHDMTCLMDWRRTSQVQGLIAAARIEGHFIGQHPLIRARIRQALGDTIADDATQAIFTWYLWEQNFAAADPRAQETVGVSPEEADRAKLSLQPAAIQRRSLPAIGHNIEALIAAVRECEGGATRRELVGAIREAAPQLNESSTGTVVSQARGAFRLIHLSGESYHPTSEGEAFLKSPHPARELQEPLIERVFGVGHLLRRLLATEEMGQANALEWLQSLVPTWTSTMPASFIVWWCELTGLIDGFTSGGLKHVRLTEAGEFYANALPADFEERWRIEPVVDNLSAPGDDGASPRSGGGQITGEVYNIDNILADGCFFSASKLDALLGLLNRKKNLVLQGPPGTGKTWLARRLGYALIGERDPLRVQAVQFHPSLSYEDFVQGWRPDGAGGLELADGRFLELARDALNDPGRRYVLVIEEINRGNPAQIFGELLTLIEADKRKPEEALRLAYARPEDRPTYIPDNFYVIGTMNIADRSLALVDLALRRRFAFETLEPALNEAWCKWCSDAGAPRWLVDDIQKQLLSLNRAIADDNRLGSHFCVGHSFVTPRRSGEADWPAWYRSVVETEIGPLLDEYWYDDKRKAGEEKAKLVLAS